MSKTLLNDSDHWIAIESNGTSEQLDVVRVASKRDFFNQATGSTDRLVDGMERNAAVPLAKLQTALRRVTGPRKSWDEHFLDIAALVASRSKDPSTKVGAVIMDATRRIVSTGYNGFARGVEDTAERLFNRELKYPLTLHAELNAILFAERGGARPLTIYIWPSPPCAPCASAIIQKGISEVVSPPASLDILSRWGEQLMLAKTILHEANVRQRFVGEAVEP